MRPLKDVLLSKSDELSGACRKFFERLKSHLKKEGKSIFYASEIRKIFRINPSTLKSRMYELSRYGMIRIVGGNRYRKGFEYEIIDKKEYDELKNSIGNALDIALEKLKEIA